MKAGRDLDALIAEKAMNLDVVQSKDHGSGWWGEGQRIIFRQGDAQICGRAPDGGVVHYDIPHYSTQIADAWLVVEKMLELPKKQSEWFGIEEIRQGWEVGFKYHEQYDGEFYNDECSAKADTVPLAICLAALRAVENK